MPDNKEKAPQDWVNPIDEDKVAETPHNLPYAHNVGSQLIEPIDRGRVKGRAVSAMYDQTEAQLDQIREQIELLARQARQIKQRVHISEEIYLAEMNFDPLIGKIYHLYRRADDRPVLSLVGPREWGGRPPYAFMATVRLLSDHTWEILESGEIEQSS